MKQHGKTFGLVLAALVAGVILGSLSIAFAGPQKAAGPVGAAAVAPAAGCPMSDSAAGDAVCGGGECGVASGECAGAAECDGVCDVTGEPCDGTCDGAACGQAAAAGGCGMGAGGACGAGGGACGAMAPEATF